MIRTRLSVIILNYNTKELLEDCLNSVELHSKEVPMEVIVSDNASTDGSPEMIKTKFPWVKYTEGPNEGFSKGNNQGIKAAKGKYILLLNSDTIFHENSCKRMIDIIEPTPKTIDSLMHLEIPAGVDIEVKM